MFSKKSMFHLLSCLVFMVCICSCNKQKACRTCTASYSTGGAAFASEEACSAAEEDAFRAEYSGVAYEVSCR